MADITISYAADTQELVSGTQAGVDALTKLAGSAQSLTPRLEAAGAASDGASASLLKIGGSALTAATGTDKLIDGLRTGNIVAAADALSSLAGAAAALGPVGAAITAAGGAIAYVVADALEASRAVNQLAAALTSTGRSAEAAKAFVLDEVNAVKALGDLSGKEAREIVAAVTSATGGMTGLTREVDQLQPLFERSFGAQASARMAELAASLGHLSSDGLQRIDEKMVHLSPDVYATAQALLGLGKEAEAADAILRGIAKDAHLPFKTMSDEIAQVTAQLPELIGQARRAQEAWDKVSANASIDDAKFDSGAWIGLQQANQAVDKLLARLESLKANVAGDDKQSSNDGMNRELDAALRLNAALKERKEIQEELAARFEADAQKARDQGNAPAEGQFLEAAKRARAAETTLDQEAAAQRAESERQASEKTLQAMVAADDAALSAARAGSAQRIAILQAEVAQATRLFGAKSIEEGQAISRLDGAYREQAAEREQIARDSAEKAVKAADDEFDRVMKDADKAVAAGRLSASERAKIDGEAVDRRIAAQARALQQELHDEDLSVAAARDVQARIDAIRKEGDQEKRALAEEADKEDKRVDQQWASYQRRMASEELADKKALLAAQVAAGEISKEQETAILDRYELEQYRSVKATLEQELEGQAAHTKKSVELWEQLYDAAMRYQRAIAQNARVESQQQASAWRSSIREMETAEDQLVRDVLTKRQSLAKSLMQVSSKLVVDEIANDVKWATEHLLLGKTMLASDTAAAKGGLLAQLLSATQKEAADTKVAATHATNEAAMTSATEAGAATRTAVATGADTATAAADSASAGQSITRHAASAAAAVYDDVAQIPYVGWLLAPIAAGAAFVAVEAFGNLIPSAAGGMVVGGDGLIMAHAQEMVLPAHLSSGIQGIIDAGGAGAGAAGAGGASVSPSFNISALDARSVVALFNSPNIMRQIARNLSGYMAMNPSVRGAY